MHDSNLPEKRSEQPVAPAAEPKTAVPPPEGAVNVDVYLRAPHSPFSNRVALLFFLILTPILCSVVYLFAHVSTSGIGLERDIRNAREVQMLDRFEERVAASPDRETLQKLLQLQRVRLSSRNLLQQAPALSTAAMTALAEGLSSLDIQAYPEDAAQLLREMTDALLTLSTRPPEALPPGLARPVLVLTEALRTQARTLAPEEDAAVDLDSLNEVERRLVMKSAAAGGTAESSREVIAALDPALVEHNPHLLALRNTSHDPQSFLNTVIGQWLGGDRETRETLARWTVQPELTLHDLLLGRHREMPARPPRELELSALVSFRRALASGQGVAAVGQAAEIHRAWSGYDAILRYVSQRLVQEAAADQLSTLPAPEATGALADERRWFTAQEAVLEQVAEAEGVLGPWRRFSAGYLQGTDPERQDPLEVLRADLAELLSQQNPAFSDAAQRISGFTQQYESVLAAGQQDDPRLRFMLQLTERVYLPLLRWIEADEAATAGLLDEAHRALWQLLQATPAAAGQADTTDVFPGKDTLWRFGAGPLEGILLWGDDDLYTDAPPSPEQITLAMSDVHVEWLAVGEQPHFVLLQETAAALWLALQIQARRAGTTADLDTAADGARLPLPRDAESAGIAGAEAFGAMLLRSVPLPIKLGLQGEWLKRREEVFLKHPQARRPVLFNGFAFASDFARTPAFLQAFDVTPVFHPGFYEALDAYRAEVPGLLELSPADAVSAASTLPDAVEQRRALHEALSAQAPSAKPLIELVRSEALLRAFIEQGWYPGGSDRPGKTAAAQNLTGPWASSFERLVAIEPIGRAASTAETLERLGLVPDYPMWTVPVLQAEPRTVLQLSRLVHAAWGFLGMRYGEGDYFSPTPFNQKLGADDFEGTYRTNRDAYPQLFDQR